MALARYGAGIVEIRGSLGGQYFTQDKSGNHISAQPRIIKRRTTAQAKQRNAFHVAIKFCENPICRKINIYRVLNGLQPKHVHVN